MLVNHRRKYLLATTIALSLASCQKKAIVTDTAGTQETAKVTTQKKNEAPFALLLAFAQFSKNDEGKFKPEPAKSILLHREGHSWRPETLADDASKVIHKAYCRADQQGQPGVVTIGASPARLQYWQRTDDGRLTPSTIYTGTFGGKTDRLRDIEEGDLTGDGQTDQIIVTHDQGVILLGTTNSKGQWQYEEIWRRPQTFIHEVEIGDLEGDGGFDFFATPSEPNKVGVSQDGQVLRGHFDRLEHTFSITPLKTYTGRHAKEILTHDFDHDGRDELYISLEAKLDKKTKQVLEPLEIQQITFQNGEYRSQTIAILDGQQARVLTPVRLAGGSHNEHLLVTTLNGGIFLLTPNEDKQWNIMLVDKDSKGFEHASVAADSDGDGQDELFVFADKSSTLSQYTWQNGHFTKKIILRLAATDIIWNIVSCQGDLVP